MQYTRETNRGVLGYNADAVPDTGGRYVWCVRVCVLACVRNKPGRSTVRRDPCMLHNMRGRQVQQCIGRANVIITKDSPFQDGPGAAVDFAGERGMF